MNEGDQFALFSLLAKRLGPGGLLLGDALSSHAGDASTTTRIPPVAVLRPADVSAVADCVAIASRLRAPITIQGGLTGLCGGATPSPGSVALSLERMTGVEEIDPQARTLTALAGTPLQTAQEAAAEANFLFPIDFTARGTATIGGIVATNAGGNRVLRYGMTRASVLGLEAVLADGTVVGSLTKMMKNNAGFDLKQLFIGSEGLLGVVTRAVFALQPLPRWSGSALVAVADFDRAQALLASAQASIGLLLSAFEAMWPDYWRMVTENVAGRRDPFAAPHGLYLLIEAHGADPERDKAAFEAWIEQAFETGMVEDGAVAASQADMADFWAIREASADIEPVLGAHESFDLGLPPARIGPFVEACRAQLAAAFPDQPSVFFGHVADGNVHVMAAVPAPAGPDERRAVERIVYDATRAFGGSVSAEHGIGTLKRAWLAHSRNDAEIALMRRIKATLDPLGLLNPGKLLP